MIKNASMIKGTVYKKMVFLSFHFFTILRQHEFPSFGSPNPRGELIDFFPNREKKIKPHQKEGRNANFFSTIFRRDSRERRIEIDRRGE